MHEQSRWDEWAPKQCKSCGQDFHFKPMADSPAWARSGDQWFHLEDTKFLCVRCHKQDLIGGSEHLKTFCGSCGCGMFFTWRRTETGLAVCDPCFAHSSHDDFDSRCAICRVEQNDARSRALVFRWRALLTASKFILTSMVPGRRKGRREE